jgi:hypothetical protein
LRVERGEREREAEREREREESIGHMEPKRAHDGASMEEEEEEEEGHDRQQAGTRDIGTIRTRRTTTRKHFFSYFPPRGE